jgi:hypothetical protein
MKRTLLAVSMIGAVSLSAVAAHAEGQTAGAEPIGTAGFAMPTVSPNWTPTAEGAIARQQIHDAGYGNVTMLMRNSDGSWQGQALKGDTYYMISLDPSGHVTQR